MNTNYVEVDAESLDFVQIGPVEDFPNGERVLLEIDEYNIVVFNIAGKHFAIADLCTHDDGPLGEGDISDEFPNEVECPRHGARFDVRNGKATKLPGIVDIPAYPVRIVDGQLEIGIPQE